MARFAIDEPITTRLPTIAVDEGLPIGRHRFRLLVVDVEGRRSDPHDAIVEIQRTIGGGVIVPPAADITRPQPVVERPARTERAGAPVPPARPRRARRRKEES
jgi:hypothetical protein